MEFIAEKDIKDLANPGEVLPYSIQMQEFLFTNPMI